jgi:hypothetical protein
MKLMKKILDNYIIKLEKLPWWKLFLCYLIFDY